MRCIQLISVVILTATLVFNGPKMTVAEVSGFHLWPFQDERDSAAFVDNVAVEGEQPWLWRSPFANVGWPEITLPRIQILPRISGSERRRILGQNGPTLRERMAATRHTIARRTRQAWNRSLETLKFGRNDDPATKIREPRLPFFRRILGSQQEQYQGPRTVGEWLEQDRLEP